MPCSTCGSEIVYIGDWPGSPKCPKCDSLAIVSRPLSIEISQKRLDYLDQLFMKFMKQFKKELLIAHIVWAREKFARSFFDEYQPFEMAKFVSYSFLIRRLMAEKDFLGTNEATENATKQLIETFATYLGHRVKHIYLQDGFGELMAKASFDPNALTPHQMLSNFVVVYTERFLPIHETFANNEIYDDATGKRKFEEYSRERDELIKNPPTQKTKYSPEGLIKDSYQLLNTLYCGLLKNEIYAEQSFGFSNYKRASITPAKLMEVTNKFSMYTDGPTLIDGALLRVELDKVFDGNQDTFPLFVELDDRILIPHRTAFIIFLLLHPLLHKDIFNQETERRSKELESVKAKAAFETEKFDYLPNLTDKKNATLEIDGIATRGRTMYVVEVKGWGIGTYFEHKERQEWLVRDLKGIVDGYKYSTIDGNTRSESIVSLAAKVQFVKQNMSICGFRSTDYDVIKGIIVMKDYPPINDYKDVRIVSLQSVDKLP